MQRNRKKRPAPPLDPPSNSDVTPEDEQENPTKKLKVEDGEGPSEGKSASSDANADDKRTNAQGAYSLPTGYEHLG